MTTDVINGVPRELLPCPFCGDVPELPSGDGTQYEIECGGCGQAMASVQISDLMTIEERSADPLTEYRYAEEFIERAKRKAIKYWNDRVPLATAQPAADHSEHDLNMVSQPAADGEREVWAVPVLDGEKKTTFYTEQLPFVPGIGVKQLGEPVRMVEARAAQPAADGEREAFEAYCQTIGYTLKSGDSGHYLGGYGAEIWAGWKARAAQPQQAVAVADEMRRLREALEVCVEVIERFSYRWNGQGKHPQMALNGAKAALAAHKTGEEE